MEDTDELLKTMSSLIRRASALSTDLANFICAESIPLGEVIGDWLDCHSSSNVNITHRETEQLIKQRQAATWVKAERRFACQELGVLTDWQTLEAKALTLSINIIMEKSPQLQKRKREFAPE